MFNSSAIKIEESYCKHRRREQQTWPGYEGVQLFQADWLEPDLGKWL